MRPKQVFMYQEMDRACRRTIECPYVAGGADAVEQTPLWQLLVEAVEELGIDPSWPQIGVFYIIA